MKSIHGSLEIIPGGQNIGLAFKGWKKIYQAD